MIIDNNAAQRPRDEKLYNPENHSEEQIVSDKQADVSACPDEISFGKFNSLEELLNAYNRLQAQFTKRSQRLSEVIKENRALKEQANAAAKICCPQEVSENENNEIIERETDCENRAQNTATEDETGNAARVFGEQANASRTADSDVYGAEAERFLKQNPSAAKYVGEIADKAAEKGDLSSGFLERAFIAVLSDIAEKNEAEREDDQKIFEIAVSRPAVYEKMIIKYLNDVKSKGAAKLITAGLVSTAPPVKPKSIEEAGAFASSVLKQKF